MFNFFKKNTISIGDKFALKSNNYFQIILTIISIDNDILGVHIYDNYNKVEVVSHMPIFIKDFNRSNITFLGKDENIKNFSLDGYKNWKEASGGVFNIKIEELIDGFKTNKLIFLREDDSSKRDYSLLKHKGLSTKAIFSDDGENVVGLYPLHKRVLFPHIGFPEGDIVINNFKFVNLGNIEINNTKINIGYYDYSSVLNKGNFDLEMFNFSYKNIGKDLYNILRVIKEIDYQIIDFKEGLDIGINDFSVIFDKQQNKYIFNWYKNTYTLGKDEAELLINKYSELLKKFISDKNIIIDIDSNLIK